MGLNMGIGGLNSIGFEFEGSDPDSILCQMAAQTFKFSDWALSLLLHAATSLETIFQVH